MYMNIGLSDGVEYRMRAIIERLSADWGTERCILTGIDDDKSFSLAW